MSNNSKALVLLSGGADSTICLYWALENYTQVEALNISYGQKHSIEIKAAREIARKAKVTLYEVTTNIFQQLGDSALVTGGEVNEKHRSGLLPASFVPGRNILFLTIAGAFAYKLGAGSIITGTCQTDYSGYPDCRSEFIEAFGHALQLGLQYQLEIRTPLMFLSKAESVHLAASMPGCLDALALSHTCYNGKRPPCGQCPSCLLREKGFKEAGIVDPLTRACGKEA